jgi:magnesium-transporting ATPase (P-type)
MTYLDRDDAEINREGPPTWHGSAAAEVVARLRANLARGLDEAEVARRLAAHGPNLLPAEHRPGAFARVQHQFHNVLVYVLLAAGFVKLMLSLWVDAGVIFAVVILNALLGFFQEGRAEKSLESIRSMLSPEARALRSGASRMVEAETLVPGDVVLLESGDRVPADVRLVEVKNLRAEESALTGESVPVDKSTAAVEDRAPVGDRAGMAYAGTLIVSGRATGVVVETGGRTELGRINQMLRGVSALETPLLLQIKKFGTTITGIILVIGVITFVFGKFVRGIGFVEMFQAVTGIAVSMIPEGLPALITITMAIGVQRMAARNAIVRRLPAVETLGSVTRICSDKTGTLTLMEMMVVSAVTAEGTVQVSGAGYDPEGAVTREEDGQAAGADPVLSWIGRLSVLCNDAELKKVDGSWKVDGDPTEGALYPFADKLGLDRDEVRATMPRLDSIPFESEHRFMATLNQNGADGGRVFLVKGAPEVILTHCNREQYVDGSKRILCPERWKEASHRLASRGERVLALAFQENTVLEPGGLGPADLPRDLVMLGLVGLLDPPRPEAIEAVRECQAGGVRVTMITGDHAVTAAAIARMLNIGDGTTALTGEQVEAMSLVALQDAVKDVDVFARASPENKLRLVQAIQANGEVVAMTGDGVNDAPALKKANIGVAMGIKGTEVTKEAGAMVLADDNFASISAAIREGRTVYNNIEKAILFLLPTNVAQAMVILVAIFAGLTMPITATQVLWVNMVTSVTLGLVLSFEPHELDVMRRRPRRGDQRLLDGFALWRIAFVSLGLLALTLGAFFGMKAWGADDAMARAAAVNALTIGQVFYLLNSRFKVDSSLSLDAHRGNRFLVPSIGALVALQLLFTYAPPFQALFGTAPPPLWLWPLLVLGGFAMFLAIEAEKAVVRSRRREAEAGPAGAS